MERNGQEMGAGGADWGIRGHHPKPRDRGLPEFQESRM